jgi:hypothetical protein
MGSINQIYANLQNIGFTNPSNASIYGQIANAIAPIIDNTIAEINNSESIITNLLISQNGYGKSAYYVQTALAFQYGYNLSINTNINPVTGAPYLNLYYPTIDTTAQIINQAAIQTGTNGSFVSLFLKVATTANGGTLGPLNSAQLTSFSNYMLNFEILGLPLNIITLPANILNFTVNCSFNASYNSTTLEAAVQTQLLNFQNSFAFNGVFYAGQLESYIVNNVPGVIDFYIYNSTVDNVVFEGSTVLSAGYFNYNSDILSGANINYIAVNQ